ncbi:MAG: hypothetical protein GY786_14480 [Proteobacteria bacterium]|nr:hypothetical protein [Pseudomonadota bacterium]
MIRSKITILLLLGFMCIGCAEKQRRIPVLSPAEIETRGIQKVAVGKFEIGYLNESYKEERNGVWKTRPVDLSTRQITSISQQVRARVINALGATPYFSLVYTDEFEKLENDSGLQTLISSQGYQSQGVDAVINGKIWIDLQKNDGSEVHKSSMTYAQGGGDRSLKVTVEKLVWWPFKSMRGNLTLEIKMTRINPTSVVALTVDSRTFGHRVGSLPKDLMSNVRSGFNLVNEQLSQAKSPKSSGLEHADEVLPSFDQLIAQLSASIATNFIRRVAVTEKLVAYPVDAEGDKKSVLLIEAGAYEMAIERLEKVTANKKNPEDLYNLGLSYEALGEYGIAANTYEEAIALKPLKLLYAEGAGRVERVLREHPRLKQQLSQK